VGGLSKGFITADQFQIGASAQDSSDRLIKKTKALFGKAFKLHALVIFRASLNWLT
jgi:hypothetical protein